MSQVFRISVWPKSSEYDPRGRGVLCSAQELGIRSIEGVRSVALTFLLADLELAAVRQLAGFLLADSVVEDFDVVEGMDRADDTGPAIEIHYLPGVMDTAALSILNAGREVLERLNPGTGSRLHEVRTARRFRIVGSPSDSDLESLAHKSLANNCIQAYYIRGSARNDALPNRFPIPPQASAALKTVAIRNRSADELARMSRELHLFLSPAEMETICKHFAGLGRDPTDLELETLAQTWSEHCVHKTLKSEVLYRGAPMGGEREGLVEIHYTNLLKDTIAKATATVNKPWCLSVFVDNAGVITFDDDYGIAFKVETHNHPSAIEPYGGSATGVGGCIRDIMGCGLGAKPVANTDVFCLAPPDWDESRLPLGVLHPRRVMRGVVAGVRDYGNCMGIPTVNGAFHFDERYLANPLVFCGCIGLIPRNRVNKSASPGDFIVVAGGRTGRDGIHGATFSSAELTDTHADEFSHAVQIGNPIEEKKLLDAMLIARDHPSGCLYSAVTDCGAGGLSSAVGEMGAEIGAEVDLDRVPLKYSGLRYDEIWISEAQERMVFAVPPKSIEAFLALMKEEEVEATVIGKFTGDHRLRVRYLSNVVGELDMEFLHHGLPRQQRKAHWTPLAHQVHAKSAQFGGRSSVAKTRTNSLHDRLLQELSSWNVASKEFAIRVYDHEVQAGSVVKPLVGPGFGPSDAAVFRPRLDSYRGIAVGCGLRPDLFDEDPYWMAVASVDEAVRNVVCVGADLDHTALLDNFCWGGCEDELAMGTLVRACQGAHDAAVAYGLPFISGKDSLNNQFSQSTEEARRTRLPERFAIPGSLLISALSVVRDVRHCVTMDLKEPGHGIFLMHCSVRDVGLDAAAMFHRTVANWINEGLVAAAHDVSDGGLLVALAEMCIAGELGADITLSEKRVRDLEGGFTPWSAAYVLEEAGSKPLSLGVAPGRLQSIGGTTGAPTLNIMAGDAGPVEWSLAELRNAWKRIW